MLELGGAVVSVLDRSGREDVRLHQPRCHNTSAVSLRGYVDTLSPLIAILLLDRSCMIIGNFLKLLHSPTLLTYANYSNILLYQMNAKSAFLHGVIDEEYMLGSHLALKILSFLTNFSG